MLDADTKRRIDTARDILVGKVPDPKSQVEQITIALIYKFMDDMDAGAEELGGTRSFFAGDFQRYGWARLMHGGLGGHEMLNLYAEAITKMPENPGIPPLFRDIFKNAYLPYRDPETLRAFLKIIDEFEYDHSERLGDAFEYLLSVLGSQGDAGQFRTPRHIIDFIIEVVDPKKSETVLDPACGTAGFLISAWKHILKANSTPHAVEEKPLADNGKAALDSSRIPPARGDLLSPDERGRLAANFKGYDISPDMVRLSLVNLYLHGFTDPHIYEYDTLTSQDRWNEHADVVLANPPFMSPKGGIKPHNGFSVQSKRSEVLFVDYMAEHLAPGGRAGIIVPEGIIFQSQGAYTQLRKMLVEDYLVAVVSLPAGLFNPYSGVKTSILILDKSLAKAATTIAFFKIENDGFGLGAQRRPIDKDDLPQARAEIAEYLRRLRERASLEDFQPTLGLVVPKELIAASGDHNLTAERYREGAVRSSSWQLVSVAEVFRRSEQSVLPESIDGPATYIGLENITQGSGAITGSVITDRPSDIRSLKNVFKLGDILYGKLRPNLNKVWLADRNGICSTDIFVIQSSDGRADPALYAYLFRSPRFNDAVIGQLKGAQLPRIGWSSFSDLQIPLPPLEVQKEIVAEIEGYQNVIDGARAVIENYRPTIPIDPDWPMVELGDVAQVIRGITFGKSEQLQAPTTNSLAVVTTKAAQARGIVGEDLYHIPRTLLKDESKLLQRGDILISTANSLNLLGRTTHVLDVEQPTSFGAFMSLIRPRANVKDVFLLCCLRTEQARGFFRAHAKTTTNISNLNTSELARFTIPFPPLATQQAIAAEIEAEQMLINANRDLIARFEKKIQGVLDRVWGEC